MPRAGFEPTIPVFERSKTIRSLVRACPLSHIYIYIYIVYTKIEFHEHSRRGLGIFLFTTASRTVLGPTQPPIQWVPGAFSLGVKRPRREADHSPTSSTEVKECVELYLHSQYAFMAWCLVKHRDFTY
jgi:hypothetical protein